MRKIDVSLFSGRLLPILLGLVPLALGCAGARIRSASDVVKTVPDLVYVTGSSDPKHQLDLYLPRGKTGFPMVHFVHGGFWRNQDRRYHQGLTGLYGNIGVALARRGIGVAVQSYRLSPQVGIEDQLHDVLSAIRFTIDHSAEYGGDAQRLFLAGYSAGGHLISELCIERSRLQNAGIEPRLVRGCISLSGVLDLVSMAAQQDEAFNREVTWRLFGKSAADQTRYSPVEHLVADMPPLLLLTAADDYPFVKQAATTVAERLHKLGARPTLLELPGYSHADMVLNINSKSDLVTHPMVEFISAITARAEGETASK